MLIAKKGMPFTVGKNLLVLLFAKSFGKADTISGTACCITVLLI